MDDAAGLIIITSAVSRERRRRLGTSASVNLRPRSFNREEDSPSLLHAAYLAE